MSSEDTGLLTVSLRRVGELPVLRLYSSGDSFQLFDADVHRLCQSPYSARKASLESAVEPCCGSLARRTTRWVRRPASHEGDRGNRRS